MAKTNLYRILMCAALAAGLAAAPSMAADAPTANLPAADGKPEAMKDAGAPAIVNAAPAATSRAVPADAAPAPMTAEEKKKARAEARREAQLKLAAERAAAEKARLEEEIRLCVIKPVMTDAEIDSCRKAGKRRI